MPLPIVPTRVRRVKSGFAVPAVAAESKPSEPVQARELVSNPAVKAPEAPEPLRADTPVQATRGFAPEPLALKPSVAEPSDIIPKSKVLPDEATDQVAETTTGRSQDNEIAPESRGIPSSTHEQAQTAPVGFFDDILKEELEVTERLAPRDDASLDSSGQESEAGEDDNRSVSSVAQKEVHSMGIQDGHPAVESLDDVASVHSEDEADVYHSIITAPLSLDRRVSAHQLPVEIPQVVIDEPAAIPPANGSAEEMLEVYQQHEEEAHRDAASIAGSENETKNDSVPTLEQARHDDDNLGAYPAPLSVVQTPKSPRSPAPSPTNSEERGLDSDDEISDVEEIYNSRDVRRSISELASTEPEVAPGANKALQVFDNLVKLVETLEKSQPRQGENTDGGDDRDLSLAHHSDDLNQGASGYTSLEPSAVVQDAPNAVDMTHVEQDNCELESEEIIPVQVKPDIKAQVEKIPYESGSEDDKDKKEEESSKPLHEEPVLVQTASATKTREALSPYESDFGGVDYIREGDFLKPVHEEPELAHAVSAMAIQEAQSPFEFGFEDASRTREEVSRMPERDETVLTQSASDIKSQDYQSQYASDSDDLNRREDVARNLEHDEGILAQTASGIKTQELQRPYASDSEDETSPRRHADQPELATEPKIGYSASLPADEVLPVHEATAHVEVMIQHQQLSVPGQQNQGYASTDTDSQVFVTPLTSAGFRSPCVPMEQRTLAYELDHADDSDDSDYEDHADHHRGPEHYRLEEEQTMTVHGGDNLFDYSDNSVRSSGGGSGSSHRGEEDARSHANDLENPRPPSIEGDPAAVHALPIEKPALANVADNKNRWADDVESDIEEESNPPTTLATPPTHAAQTPATDIDITPFEMAKATSPSANRGLAASRHNPQRPQTPAEEHAEEVFDAENFMPRDITNVSWHERSDSDPQSLHSQSTIDSSPSSPEQIHSHDTRDPAIRYSWQTGSTNQFTSRLRGDSVMTDGSGQFGRFESPISRKESPPPPLPEWQPESVETAALAPSQWEMSDPLDDVSEDNDDMPAQPPNPPSSGTGSLFQRMRSVFEQTPSSKNSRLSAPSLPTSLTGKGSPVRSRPLSGLPRPTASSRTGLYDGEDDNDSDEHSSLLAGGDHHSARLSA